jgi:CDP-diglyceride synthetase
VILIALWAAIAMVIQDVLAVMMVQAEARNRGWLAGSFDSLQWLAGIATTTISVTALQGHDFPRKVLVICAVSAANMFGSLLGVRLGKRFIKDAS